MKKLSLLLVLILSATVYGKEVPGPIWYSISQKIITGSHQLISSDMDFMVKGSTKQKSAKGVKTLKVVSKHQPKKEIIIPDYFTPPVTKNVWFLPTE